MLLLLLLLTMMVTIQLVPYSVDEFDNMRQSGSVQWGLAVVQEDVCLTKHNMVAGTNFRVERQQRSDTVRPFLLVVVELVLMLMLLLLLLFLMMTVVVEVEFQIQSTKSSCRTGYTDVSWVVMDMNIKHTCVVHDLVVTIQICHGPTIPTVDCYNVQYFVRTHVAGRTWAGTIGHVNFSFWCFGRGIGRRRRIVMIRSLLGRALVFCSSLLSTDMMNGAMLNRLH